MNAQLSLFELMRPVGIFKPIDGLGQVVQGPIDEVYDCPGMKSWQRCSIEIHKDQKSGLFMWATKHFNGGYRVGPKWGKFAGSRADALELAKDELRKKIDELVARDDPLNTPASPVIKATRKWLEALK